MRLTRKQAAQHFGISLDTLKRRIKAGTIQAEKSGPGQYDAVMVIIPDPTPAAPQNPPAKIELPYQDEPVAPPVLTETEQREALDREYARAYKAGEVPDSLGNYIGGRNPAAIHGEIQTAAGAFRPNQNRSMKEIISAFLKKERALQAHFRAQGRL